MSGDKRKESHQSIQAKKISQMTPEPVDEQTPGTVYRVVPISPGCIFWIMR